MGPEYQPHGKAAVNTRVTRFWFLLLVLPGGLFVAMLFLLPPGHSASPLILLIASTLNMALVVYCLMLLRENMPQLGGAPRIRLVSLLCVAGLLVALYGWAIGLSLQWIIQQLGPPQR